MDAIGPRLRLGTKDRAGEALWWFYWKVDRRAFLIFYEPLRLTFKIKLEQRPRGRPLSARDFSGQLVQVCDGMTVPDLEEVRILTREAIYSFYRLAVATRDEADVLDDELP